MWDVKECSQWREGGFTIFIKSTMKAECLLPGQRNNCTLKHSLQLHYRKKLAVITAYWTIAFASCFTGVSASSKTHTHLGMAPPWGLSPSTCYELKSGTNFSWRTKCPYPEFNQKKR
jgi:hypothetical protein